jgi:hypothetical protein
MGAPGREAMLDYQRFMAGTRKINLEIVIIVVLT